MKRDRGKNKYQYWLLDHINLKCGIPKGPRLKNNFPLFAEYFLPMQRKASGRKFGWISWTFFFKRGGGGVNTSLEKEFTGIVFPKTQIIHICGAHIWTLDVTHFKPVLHWLVYKHISVICMIFVIILVWYFGCWPTLVWPLISNKIFQGEFFLYNP